MGSMIMQNLRNQEYLRLYETFVAGSLFAVLGPKFLDVVVYPLANMVIKYEEVDKSADRINYMQLLRLILVVCIVFIFGYVLARLPTFVKCRAAPKP